ncbi:hypothetical protein EJB05_05686, partial [Eragrostis curvula]
MGAAADLIAGARVRVPIAARVAVDVVRRGMPTPCADEGICGAGAADLVRRESQRLRLHWCRRGPARSVSRSKINIRLAAAGGNNNLH